MTKVKKDSFLIVRVDESFKQEVIARATKLGETLSEFIRKILNKEV